MPINENTRQFRCISSEFKTRAEGKDLFIEGYFAVFNSIYQLWDGATESIAEGAFKDTLGDDIRALVNHDDTLVLGRNKAGTLELKEDSHGLWGCIKVNPKDQDAMNLYERVQRRDVDQCSFGFQILDEDTEYSGQDIHWTIKKVKLYEVSVVTFPAYTETSVSARKQDFENAKQRKEQAFKTWKETLETKLKGD